jgi:hypothetical protein
MFRAEFDDLHGRTRSGQVMKAQARPRFYFDMMI